MKSLFFLIVVGYCTTSFAMQSCIPGPEREYSYYLCPPVYGDTGVAHQTYTALLLGSANASFLTFFAGSLSLPNSAHVNKAATLAGATGLVVGGLLMCLGDSNMVLGGSTLTGWLMGNEMLKVLAWLRN